MNQLRPYPGWPEFRKLVRKVLRIYQDIAKPTGFQRVGLRYINRITFDEPEVNLEKYFDFRPHIGERLTQNVSRFLLVIEVPYDNYDNVLRLQFASDLSGEETSSSFILDLDYFSNQPHVVTFTNVLAWLNRAHDRIEEFFEGSLRPELRWMFEEKTV